MNYGDCWFHSSVNRELQVCFGKKHPFSAVTHHSWPCSAVGQVVLAASCTSLPIFHGTIVCVLLWYNRLQSVSQHFTVFTQSGASSSAAMNYTHGQTCKKFPFLYLLGQPATALSTSHTLATGSKWQVNNLRSSLLNLVVSGMLHLIRCLGVDGSEGRRLSLSVTINKLKYILDFLPKYA